MKKSNRNYAKRITAFAAAIAMCLSLQLGALPASAALPSTGDIVSPNNIIINATEYDFVLKSLGVLECYGATDVPSGYIAYVKVELQQKDGSWSTIKTWSDRYECFAIVDENYAVASGYSYRLKLTYKAYDSNDNLIETLTDYSDIIYY